MAEINKKAVPSDKEKNEEIEVITDWSSIINPSENANCIKENLKSSSVVQWNPDRKKPAQRPHDAFIIRNLFSKKECTKLLAAAESHGFGVTDYPQDYRGNLRLITTDFALTKAVYERISPLLPTSVKESRQTWVPFNLNEKWRLAKYYPGHYFLAHVDAYYKPSQYEKSMYTVNIYMNNDYEGGHTRFLNQGSDLDFEILPEPGMAVVFRQPPHSSIRHDGDVVVSGVKYLFRTDAMYRLDS